MAHKQSAMHFLNLVTQGKIDEAYEKYVDFKGVHHNLHFASGFANLKKAMIENHKQFPNKTLNIINVIEQGEIIAIHSQVILIPKEKELSVVHIFKFENNKIVEMWDIGQQIQDSKNSDGAF